MTPSTGSAADPSRRVPATSSWYKWELLVLFVCLFGAAVLFAAHKSTFVRDYIGPAPRPASS